MASAVEFLLSGFTNSAGEPLALGKVYTYSAGTTTNKLTWSDSAKGTPHTNPIILDANGRKQVYGEGAYKFQINDSNDVPLYTFDNLIYSDTFTGLVTSGGSANAQTLTLSPPIKAYVAGQRITFIAGFTNTSGLTLSVSGLTAKSVLSLAGAALLANEIVVGQVVDVIYDGTQFILLSPYDTAWQTWTPSYSGASSLTYTSVSTVFARYKRKGKEVTILIRASGTTGGTTSTALQFTLPFTAANNNSVGSGYVTDNSANVAAVAFIVSTTVCQVFRYDFGNYTLGASEVLNVAMTYEAA